MKSYRRVSVILALVATVGILLAAATASAREPTGKAVATFAGGCFWCMEPPFDKLDGVLSTESGYMGGSLEDPTYKQVAAGGTGHAEVVRITYDPDVVSYEKLLEVFWRNVDPLDSGGQFCDRGDQYRTGIFYHTSEQRETAVASRQSLQDSGRFESDIVTEVTAAGRFYVAEDYHQDYYTKNPVRYRYYRFACRRDARLEQLWGDPATR